MIRRPAVFLLLLAAGCGTSWEAIDADGDGFTRQDGDCWDAVEGPAGLSGADIHPDASETWYDGVDQDCDGRDDYDQDGDGWVPEGMAGIATAGVPDSGRLPTGDCWDEIASPEGSDLGGADIHPDASETWYDGLDQDCDGSSDYDADYDGHDHAEHGGDDCDDDDAAINPDASETWYDGVDQDCDGLSDYDADRDGFDSSDHGGEDCADNDPAIYPDPSVVELWYNGIDENCDLNDGDQDGDGYWADDYEALVTAVGGDPLEVPSGFEGDCDDLVDSTNPGASEIWYDGTDQDCDGSSDYDADYDGYDSSEHAGLDCDDGDAAVNPEAFEIYYDGTDQDCDGRSDYDADRDGHDTTASGGGDCDDGDPTVSPDASEIWYDGADQDCDGLSDYDADRDSHDSSDHGGDDCDDADPGISPSASEIWYDGADQDCDGLSDYDADYDGYDSSEYSGLDCDDGRLDVFPGATEAWDGVDNDCNGLLDDMLAADVAQGWLDASAAGQQLGFTGALSFGDIDDDGQLDLLVGSTTADSSTGTVWAVDASHPTALGAPAANYASLTLFGVDPGGAMASMGPRQADVTGDGIDDLVIGGTDATDSSNSALALYQGGLGLTGELTASSAVLELTGANGAEPPVLLSHLDMDADGVAELLYADWSGQGSWGFVGSPVYLIQAAGLSGSIDLGSDDISYLFSWDEDHQPGRVMGGGDLDGDGYDDLVLGAPGYGGGDGVVALYLGSSPLPAWSWNSYTDYADLAIEGSSGSGLGASGAPQLCDLDADSATDLVIADPSNDQVYVFLAASGLLGGVYGVDQADVVISGQAGSLFGAAIQAGDVTGDGVDDLLVGAPGSDDPASPSTTWDGALYLLDGLIVSAGSSADVSQASATLLPGQASLLGAAIVIPDLDGDGVIDPVVAAPAHDGQGRVWLFPSL